MFWTFDVDNKKEFQDVPNDLKGSICASYGCNIFEKGETQVICFETGICFAITENKNDISKLIQYKEKQKMIDANLHEKTVYQMPQVSNVMQYVYILELYKSIYLNKLQTEIKDASSFSKARNSFTTFTENIYNVEMCQGLGIRDTHKIEKWENDLELEKKHINIDNQFDLAYKNDKLNEQSFQQVFLIILLIVVIGIVIINLFLGGI